MKFVSQGDWRRMRSSPNLTFMNMRSGRRVSLMLSLPTKIVKFPALWNSRLRERGPFGCGEIAGLRLSSKGAEPRSG
jgi:hypothetical protein